MSRKPFTVQPIIAGPLLGRLARTKAEPVRHAQAVSRLHNVTVAVWMDAKPGPGEAERIDLVRVIEPSRRRRRKAE